jgi:hypothetical protein
VTLGWVLNAFLRRVVPIAIDTEVMVVVVSVV